MTQEVRKNNININPHKEDLENSYEDDLEEVTENMINDEAVAEAEHLADYWGGMENRP